MKQEHTVVDCQVLVEGLALNFYLPLTIAVAYNNMRSDEFAGLLPVILQHESMQYVDSNKKKEVLNNIELMELTSSRVKIEIL